MAVNSNINPNFPLPGIDQSSRGFRDNFSTAKKEIENLQSKQIQLFGDCVSDPIAIDSGSGVIAINTQVLFHSLTVSGNQHGMLFNNSGIITSSSVYYDSANVRVGINTTTPRASLDVKNGIVIVGNTNTLTISSTVDARILTNTTNNLTIGTNNVPAIFVDRLGRVGIGHAPDRTLDVIGGEYDVARFTSTLNNTDVAVRLTTAQLNSSVGWVVENENSYAGGIRADVNGYISLHAGEMPGSGLQDGISRALTIDPISRFVGIGTATPTARLDVNGNLHVSGSLTIGGSTPTLLGSRGGNAALTNLITLLATAGFIIDGTSA
ncbi:hypothetical protein UFOVP29_73 [uncultured Caudovirales phage]|uniref:Uncharacterized protein n=1 Tax=uncultured Caudovirales phage TaxID=2100421 RepID=A0A6J5KNK6_9CAUD|nr:hypothetical protein UFOVP29_73 [uncultured Caudovirales phage]